MAKQKMVSGVQSAFVKVGTGDGAHEVVVQHGQPLPSGVSADEVKRLEDLGVFGDTPRHLLPPDKRPPLTPTPAPAPAPPVDTSGLEARAAQAEETAEALQAQLAEADEKLVVAARLAPVVAQSVEKVQEHLKEHPEDREAILFLEAHGPAPRDGILKG